MDSLTYKQCADCKEIKPTEFFSVCRRNKDGLQCYCRDCKNRRNRAWRDKNIDREREKRRRYTKDNLDKSREAARKNSKRWYWKYIDRVREMHVVTDQKRRAKEKNSAGSISREEWRNLKEFYSYTCLSCKKQEPTIKLTLDHIVPIALGGSNAIDNAQPLCETCNKSKGIKIIDYR